MKGRTFPVPADGDRLIFAFAAQYKNMKPIDHIKTFLDPAMRMRAYLDAFRASSDSEGAGLMVEALAAELQEALAERFVQSHPVEQELFDGTAPLSSLDARASMAFYIGAISRDCLTEIRLVAAIADAVLNSPEQSFEHGQASELTRQLRFSRATDDPGSRAKVSASFTAQLLILSSSIDAAEFLNEAVSELPSDEQKEIIRRSVKFADDSLKAVLRNATQR